MTEKQSAYIRRLLAERDPIAVQAIRDTLNKQREAGELGKSEASAAIKLLLAIPKLPKPPTQQVDFDAIELGYYVHGDDVYVVVENEAKTRRYAKQLVLRTDGRKGARWTYVRGAISRLDGLEVLTVDEAARLGRLHGVCMVCGKALTVPQSVLDGIGPVCIKKLMS